MSDRKPSPAQIEALRFVARHAVAISRPTDYHGRSHGVNVRRDVWYRCHKNGWLETHPGRPWSSRITEAGREVLAAHDHPPKTRPEQS